MNLSEREKRNLKFKTMMKRNGKIVRSSEEQFYSGCYVFYCPEHGESNDEGFVHYSARRDSYRPMNDYLNYNYLCIDTRENFAKLKKELKLDSLDFKLIILPSKNLKVGCQEIKEKDVYLIKEFLNEHYK